MTKICPRCKTEKPLSGFARCSKRAHLDGLQAYCKVCSTNARREWAITNPDQARAHSAAYYVRNSEAIRADRRQYWHERATEDQKTAWAVTRTALYVALRAEAIAHLGNKCAGCGNSDPRVLQIDHVNSGGAKERKSSHPSTILRRVLASNPGELYQCLCANCNWIARHERGEWGGGVKKTA